MKRPQPLWMLLALALLAGQWLTVAHAAEHTNNQADDALCAICIQVQNLEQAQHSSPIVTIDAQADLAPLQAAALPTVDASLPQTRIRAPPTSL